jgi:hypothetical protein
MDNPPKVSEDYLKHLAEVDNYNRTIDKFLFIFMLIAIIGIISVIYVGQTHIRSFPCY